MAQEIWLADRGVARVAGPEAPHFLQNLVTQDVEGAPVGALRFAALLSPQGKVLYDFFVHRRAEDEFWLDAPAALTADLVKRLTLYRLRAKVEITDLGAAYAVVVAPEGEPADPRAAGLGARRIVAHAEAPTERAAYDARRVELGVPEGGRDFAYGDVFPHDVNMDLLNGVDFAKGCYIGQEVVSRMRHRGEARKRVVLVEGDGRLETGAAVMDGELPVGALGTAADVRALALLRLDRAEAAQEAGRPLIAGGRRIRVLSPKGSG